MADPVFPRGISINSKGGCEKLLFNQFLFKNCMKLKEFGPRGVRAALVPLLDVLMVIVMSLLDDDNGPCYEILF